MNSNIFGANASPAGLIDNMLGKAFLAVQIVADQIDTIKEIAANIPAIKDAARNTARSLVVVTGTTGTLGSIAYVQLPAGITAVDVLDSSVILVGTGIGAPVYSESSGHFASVITAGYLEVDLSAVAPAVLAAAEIRWTLFYKV